MAVIKDLSVGERWAYRRSDLDALTEVEVLGVSNASPARVEIVYVALPGSATAWVPPSRLKVRWLERERFLRREAQWRTISSRPTGVECMAVTAVVEEFIRPAASIGSGKRMSGTIAIYDADLVDVFMGGGLDGVLQGESCVDEGGAAHYGWQVAVAIAKRTCRTKPARVMEFVAAEEASDRADVLAGRAVSPQRQLLEASTRQAWDLLRDWCGRGVAARDQIVRLRNENARLQVLLDEAVAVIADRVDQAAARTLFDQARQDATEGEWQMFLKAAARLAE